MTQVTLLAAVVIATSFTSCKKSYTCECTTTINNGSSSSTTSSSIISGKMKKSDATQWCNEAHNQNSAYAYNSCSLK